jgi:flagellum-specific peptidoglycan hydrolase FlgJ
MKQRVFNVLISLAVLGLGAVVLSDHYKGDDPPQCGVVDVKLVQPEFLLSENPEEDLIAVMDYYGVKHPEIVYAQAILETGHFRSKVYRECNNLFGLYNSRTKSYYKFDHWSESVVAYLDYIQYRYKPPNDYYKFLSDIGYAEDPEYINKLKRIVNQYDKRRATDTVSTTN